MTIASPINFDVWKLELDALEAEIVALSGAPRERLHQAANVLAEGFDLYRDDQGLDEGAYIDPYDCCISFVESSALPRVLDSTAANGLSGRQLHLAMAWHYVDLARWLARPPDASQKRNEEDVLARALWHKLAARKLIDDSVGSLPPGAVQLLR